MKMKRYYYNKEVNLIKEIDEKRSLIEVVDYSIDPHTGEDYEVYVEIMVDTNKLHENEINFDDEAEKILNKADSSSRKIINDAKREASRIISEAHQEKNKIIKEMDTISQSYEMIKDIGSLLKKEVKYILYFKYSSINIIKADIADDYSILINYKRQLSKKNEFKISHKVNVPYYSDGSGNELYNCYLFHSEDELKNHLINFFETCSEDHLILNSLKIYDEYNLNIEKVENLKEKNEEKKVLKKQERVNKLKEELLKEETSLNKLKMKL